MRRKDFLILILAVTLIFSMGILMVFNISAAEVLDRKLDLSLYHALFKQTMYAAVSIAMAYLVFWIGYPFFLKFSGALLILATLLLVLVFVPGIGQQINGAHRWIRIFGNSLQPSECVKYLIPLYYVHVTTSKKKPLEAKEFYKLLAMIAIPIGLIWIEPDNGSVFIIMIALLALFILTKVRWTYWALPLCLFSICAALVALKMKHVPDRLYVYFHPESDLRGKGHQPYQAKIAAGSGGLFGKGIGESLQKLDYLPEARSDYIAAIFAEEFGFVGILGLIFLYITLGAVGFYLAMKATDPSAFYLIAIFIFLLCFQAFLNLGVVSGLLPSKGTNLPFFSQGGSSLFVNFIALGLIMSAARKKVETAHAK